MKILQISQWKMNFDKYRDIPCEIPCSVYSVLIDNELIAHPYIGLNEKEATYLSEKDSEFYTSFEVTETEISCEHNILRFEGLDTLCDIYLNGTLLAQTDNMHRTYEFCVKDRLILGKNKLSVKIKSPMKYVRAMDARYSAYTNADSVPGAAHIRKASYMFGWDWGPTLPDMGIWRKVELISYNVARFENALIRQFHENGKVRLEITAEILGNCDAACSVEIEGKKYELKDNFCSVELDNPKLWYPNGLGEQPLYDLRFELSVNGEILDTMQKTIGLRTIEISREKDEYGKEFCFVVNGHKIFARGANYIPADTIARGITADKLKTLIDDCVMANYNMIRVWGGGMYPPDEFFDYCDRAGIIVWQDFMVGCMQVYMRKKFEETIVAEAIDNVKRIRHHASLGLLCGNNEMEVTPIIAGFDKDMLMVMDYLRLHERLFPDICEEYAPEIFYLPSSPTSGGGFNNPRDENYGDSHYWDIYYNLVPYEDYRKHYFRFLSEFGMQSYPNFKTTDYLFGGVEKNACGPVMEAHQKCPGGTRRILCYAAMDHLYSSDFDTLTYASQLVQASSMKCAVEHMRRNRGRCMGALYWQLNDSWPVASWSTIDYFGRWKAAHYAAKRFYAPILLSLDYKGFTIEFNISNEGLNDFYGKLTYCICDNCGNTLLTANREVNAKMLSAEYVCKEDFTQYFENYEKERFVEAVLADENGTVVSRQTLLFVKPKDFSFIKPDLKVTVNRDREKAIFTVTSDVPAFDVELDFEDFDLKLNDNYFDIVNGAYTVYANTDISAELLQKSLKVRSVWNIR